MKTLRLSAFPGGFNLPIWIAQSQHYFSHEGVQVNLTYVRDAAQQMAGLFDGSTDIVMTAFDNVAANSHTEPTPAGALFNRDLAVILGSDNGFLRLVGLPEVHSVADLKGQTLSVDRPDSGFAFVLHDLLAQGGLRSSDCTIVSVGGVMQRWAALKERKHAATLLLTPFDLLAQQAGFNILANAAQIIPHYQGVVAAGRRIWLETQRESVVGFVAAYLRALRWLFDPSNDSAAVSLLSTQVSGLDEPLARSAYEVFTHPDTGFQSRGRIDSSGMLTVLELRKRYSPASADIGEPADYMDESYYCEAVLRAVGHL